MGGAAAVSAQLEAAYETALFWSAFSFWWSVASLVVAVAAIAYAVWFDK